jgi:Fe-S-cluster containining protein
MPVDCSGCPAACCKRVDSETHEIHTCQYLSEDDTCSIYEDRPIACRLDSRWTTTAMIKVHCKACQISIESKVPVTEALRQMSSSVNTS